MSRLPAARRRIVWLGAVAIAVAGLVLALHRGQAPTPPAAVQSHLRTVLVAGDALPANPAVRERDCGTTSDCPNGRGGVILVRLLSGTAPRHRALGTVLTDLSCAPDAYGISHCHNSIRLKDGTVFEVRHDHNMQRYTCLSPGEKVWVEPAADFRAQSAASGATQAL